MRTNPSRTRTVRPTLSTGASEAEFTGSLKSVSDSQNVRDVSLLSRMAWQRDGCPPGRRRQYRREVEIQLIATRHLLEEECEAEMTGNAFAGSDEPRA
jgi:hypothetical protein